MDSFKSQIHHLDEKLTSFVGSSKKDMNHKSAEVNMLKEDVRYLAVNVETLQADLNDGLNLIRSQVPSTTELQRIIVSHLSEFGTVAGEQLQIGQGSHTPVGAEIRTPYTPDFMLNEDASCLAETSMYATDKPVRTVLDRHQVQGEHIPVL